MHKLSDKQSQTKRSELSSYLLVAESLDIHRVLFGDPEVLEDANRKIICWLV